MRSAFPQYELIGVAIVVTAVYVPRRCRYSRRTGYGAQASSDRGANASTMTPACDGADHRPVPAPSSPPVIARSPGLYGSA
jgi:hypothetical protein